MHAHRDGKCFSRASCPRQRARFLRHGLPRASAAAVTFLIVAGAFASTLAGSFGTFSAAPAAAQTQAASSYQYASNGVQINSITYGGGVFLVGGAATSNSPFLGVYNPDSSSLEPLSTRLPSSFKFVLAASYFAGVFFVGGAPGGSEMAFASYNPSTGSVQDLGSFYGGVSTPSVYSIASMGGLLYLGGYWQGASAEPFLYSYNVTSHIGTNLTSVLPSGWSQVLSISSDGNDLLLVGVGCAGCGALALLYSPGGGVTKVNIPSLFALNGAAPYGGGYLAVGASSDGGALLYIGDNGSVSDMSALVSSATIELFSVSELNQQIMLAGWGTSGAYAAFLNYPSSVSRVQFNGAWDDNGSEALALAAGGASFMLVGAVVTQYSSASGGLMGSVNMQGTFTDLTVLVPKQYSSMTIEQPAGQPFFVQAEPNYVVPGGSFRLVAHDLVPSTQASVSFDGKSFQAAVNSTGGFAMQVGVPSDAPPGDHLVNVSDAGTSYYNDAAVLYASGTLTYGSKMPRNNLFGYSLIQYSGAVRYGSYVEFVRILDGPLPRDSFNYLVQWTSILYPSSVPNCFSVAPNIGRCSEYTGALVSVFDSPWSFSLTEDNTNGTTTSISASNSFTYFNGSLLEQWVPLSALNSPQSFAFTLATDYVQNSPVYTPAFRLESGQATPSTYNSTVAPTTIGSLPVQDSADYPWYSIGPRNILNPQNNHSSQLQPASGHIGLIAMDYSNPNLIYVASGTSGPGDSGPYGDGGVFKTTDGGVHWEPVDFGLPYDTATALFMDQSNPQHLLLGEWGSGIFQTDDGGGYWAKVSDFAFAKDFTDVNGTIYAGSLSGVIKSSDGGTTWTLVSPIPNIKSLAISGSTIYAYSVTSSELLYKSEDLGNSWSVVHDFTSVAYDVWGVSASPFNSSFVVVSVGQASGAPTNTWVSHDGGQTFTPYTAVAYTKQVMFDPINQSKMWAYGPAYIAYSTDGGTSFEDGPQGTDNMGLVVSPLNDNLLVMGSDQGVYQSMDGGRTWASINGNLSDLLTESVSVGPASKLIVAGMQDYSAWFSYDGGQSWVGGNVQPIPLPNEGTFAVVNPSNPNWVYAIHSGSDLMLSSDGGHTFSAVQSVVGAYPAYVSQSSIYVDPYDNTKIYVGTNEGIFIGSNYGSSWNLWDGSPGNVTSIGALSPTVFVAGTSTGAYVYKGGVWSRSSGVSAPVDYVATDPSNASVVAIMTGLGTENLYISTNQGSSFGPLHGNGQAAFANHGSYWYPNSQLFFLNITGTPLVACTFNGVFLSSDLGADWVPISYNLYSGAITGASFNGNLYLSTFGEGLVEYSHFSLDSLPATLNGTIAAGSSLAIDGTPVQSFDGHFRLFLKPGYYQLMLSTPAGTSQQSILFTPTETYTLNVAPQSTTTSGSTSSVSSVSSTPTTSSISSPSAFPPSIIAYVPVRFSGFPQNGLGFQVMVTVNSSAYASYEASDLSNVEFFFANGTAIPTWLESGATSLSNNSVYWLKSIGDQATVFLGFAPKGTSLMNGIDVGEAPQLSAKYGQLDDGAAVFSFYDNFAGPQLSNSWTVTAGGTYSVDDGLMYTANGFGSITTTASYPEGYAFDALLVSGPGPSNLGFFNTSQQQAASFYTYSGAFIRGACGNVYPDQWNNQGEANSCGSQHGYLYQGNGMASGVYTVDLLSSSSSVQYYNYGAGRSTQPIVTNPPPLPLSAGFAGRSNFVVQWARIRMGPPNGVMPVATFGPVGKTSSIITTTTQTSTLTASSTTFSTSSTSLSSTAGSIPEFSSQPLWIILIVPIIVVSYLLVRRRSSPMSLMSP